MSTPTSLAGTTWRFKKGLTTATICNAIVNRKQDILDAAEAAGLTSARISTISDYIDAFTSLGTRDCTIYAGFSWTVPLPSRTPSYSDGTWLELKHEYWQRTSTTTANGCQIYSSWHTISSDPYSAECLIYNSSDHTYSARVKDQWGVNDNNANGTFGTGYAEVTFTSFTSLYIEYDITGTLAEQVAIGILSDVADCTAQPSNSIKFGSEDIDALMLGSDTIDKIYLGDTLLYGEE